MSTPSEKPGDKELVREIYYKIPADLYRNEDRIEADIYLYYQGQYIVFKSQGMRWQNEDGERLFEFGVSDLFSKFTSPKEHRQYLDRKMKAFIERRDVPQEKKAKALVEVSEPILEGVFKTPKSSEHIDTAVSYVKSCIRFLNDKGSLTSMVQLAARGLTEHTHALHVATYAIALSNKLGHRSYDDMVVLGLGGVLHDVGKSKIDPEILQRGGNISDEDWLQIRQHPLFGEELLEKNTHVPALARRIVAEHHERINGKGYPRGIRHVNKFAQIVSIADVFNSLTSERNYGKLMAPFEALKFMALTMRDEFDPALIAGLIELLGE